MTTVTDMNQIAPLFDGWEETLIYSCLQGCMGYALTDSPASTHTSPAGFALPQSAQIIVADFCFFAGVPSESLARAAGAPIMVPQNEAWADCLAHVWGAKAARQERYAIKKEPDCFDTVRLASYRDTLPGGYTLQLFDESIYRQALANDWSRDFCSQFKDYADFHDRGLGMAVLHDGALVAGASSYTVYRGGIEIQIETQMDFRQMGLATACGAALILECLHRGLYPSWDAHDLRSAALAEKLGYHRSHPYPVYVVEDDDCHG